MKDKIVINTDKNEKVYIQEKIDTTIDTYERKINLLNAEIEKLKAKQWKYKIGAWGFVDDHIPVQIIELIDNDKEYLYVGVRKDLDSYYFENNTEYKIKFNNDNFVHITNYDSGFHNFDAIIHLRKKLCEYKQKSEELEIRLKKYE
jgi:hypothetical protein